MTLLISFVVGFLTAALIDGVRKARAKRKRAETESERIHREFAAGVERMNLQVGRALIPVVTNAMNSISDSFESIGDFHEADFYDSNERGDD
jgi:hypothetical protein